MPLEINPGIYKGVLLILLAPQTLLETTPKEVVAYAESGGVWINRTLRQVSRTGVDGSTPCDICHTVSVVEPPYPVLIGIVYNSPPCGLNARQKVENKRQSTSPGLVGKTQKLDTVVDGNLPNGID